MRRIQACLLAAVLLLAVSMSAYADVYINQEAPEDWSERDLFRIVAIDTDRSDAMFLQCGGEAMLVDSGAGGYQKQLYEVADAYGVTEFKYLYNTHTDDDHIYAFKFLIESQKYKIGMFTSPNGMDYVDPPGYHQLVMSAIRRFDVPYHVVEDGEVLTLGDASMTVMRCMEPWGRNARSATLMVTFGESRVFLTGDIDNLTMRHYVKKYGEEALRADILKSPHHGIATMPDEFIFAVNPELVFVNNLKEKAQGFINGMNYHAPEIELLFSGDASILMETDGTDWYVWQTLEE